MSLIETMLDNYKSGYSGQMDRNEWRRTQYGALQVFQEQSAAANGILSTEDIANLEKSWGSVNARIPVFDFRDVTIGATRSCLIPLDQNNTKFIQVTFVTYSFGFTMVRSMYLNNQIKYQQDWNKKFETYLLKLLKVMDQASAMRFETDKNRVFTGLNVEYPTLANAFQVPYASREDLYNQISGIMQTADFNSTSYDVVATSMHAPTYNKLASNGRTNADNTAYQLAGYDMHYTNSIIQNTGVRDTLYAIPEGQVAMVTRNAPDNRDRRSLLGGGRLWGLETIDELGFEIGTYYTEDCGDATALFADVQTTGLTRTAVEGFGFDFDCAYITAYNSNPATRTGPIMKFEIAAKAA